MTTPRELITGALRLINVVQANEVPTAEDMDISFEALNAMIDSWSNEELSIFTMNPIQFQLTPGQKDYTLGVGGDWSTDRPMDIVSMYIRYPYPTGPSTYIDLPTNQLTDEQYANLGIKYFQSAFPQKWYDDGNYPLRTISVWPIPNTDHKVLLWLWQPLIDAQDLDTDIVFPQGYERALRFALAIELAAEFGKSVPEPVKRIAMRSKATIKRLNSTPQLLTGDNAIASDQQSLFNYVTGDTIPTNT